jgi:hypothetical protein
MGLLPYLFDANLVDIVTGPGRHLWFAEGGTGIIGEVMP